MIYEAATPSIHLYFYFHASDKNLFISFILENKLLMDAFANL